MSRYYRTYLGIGMFVYDTDFETNVIDVALANGLVMGSTMPNEAQLKLLNSFMKAVKQSGEFSITDTMACFELATTYPSFALIDWKRTGTLYTLGGSGHTYSAQGIKVNGAGYINTNYNPATNAVYFNINSHNITHTILDDFAASASVMTGIQNGSPTRRLGFFPKNNSGTGNILFANDLELSAYSDTAPVAKRMVSFGRSSSTAKYVKANSNYITRSVSVVTPVVSGNYYIGALNSSGSATAYTTGTYCDFSLGAALTDTQLNARLTAKNTLLTGLGLPTI